MLYKKVHRLYLREWRLGRKFKTSNCKGKITKEPCIGSNTIWIEDNFGWR